MDDATGPGRSAGLPRAMRREMSLDLPAPSALWLSKEV
jgi:hypothetical protein